MPYHVMIIRHMYYETKVLLHLQIYSNVSIECFISEVFRFLSTKASYQISQRKFLETEILSDGIIINDIA